MTSFFNGSRSSSASSLNTVERGQPGSSLTRTSRSGVAMSESRRTHGGTPTEQRLEHQHKASVTPRGAARFLLLVVLSLTVLSLLGQLAVHFVPDFVVRDRFAATFNVDEEGNIPSLYSTLAILSCAYLLWVIARVERETGGPISRHWALMSIVFLGLATDEFIALHEEINSRLDLSSFTRYSAAAVGAVFALVFTLVFFPMLLQLPPLVRRLFILAEMLGVGLSSSSMPC
jgi:hypothetical protein